MKLRKATRQRSAIGPHEMVQVGLSNSLGHDQDVTLGETTPTVRDGERDDDERDGQRDAMEDKDKRGQPA